LLEQLNQDANTHDVSELIQQVIERTGYRDYLKPETDEGEERLENLQQLVTAAAEYSDVTPRAGLTRFIEEVALFTDVDAYDEGAAAVTLITLHAAKGLEFPVVFILGLEEGILPHARSIGGFDEDEINDELEEERRLLYVGITRAKRRLYLLRAFRRSMWGRSDTLAPSRFLQDIPKESRHKEEIVMGTRPQVNFAEMLGRPRPQMEPRPQPGFRPPVQSGEPIFTAGDKVMHSVFGEGIVVTATPVRDDTEVTVAFKDNRVGIKKLSLSFARLEKISSH
jgi:DNA helicase-2/ATP-dependent DNA helicase PcrA